MIEHSWNIDELCCGKAVWRGLSQGVASHTCKAGVSHPALNQLSFCSSPYTRHLPSIANDSSVLLAVCVINNQCAFGLHVLQDNSTDTAVLHCKNRKGLWFCRERACIFSLAVPQRCEASLCWLWLPMAFSCELFSFYHLVWERGKELSCSEETGQRCHCMRLKFPGVSVWRTAGF